MRVNQNCPAYVIDLAGSVLLLSLLGACGWLVFVAGDETRRELAGLRAAAAAAQQDLDALVRIREQQRQLLAERRKEVEAHGRLPDHPPIEEYFRDLAGLAGANRLHVVRHQPLASRTYPGLTESRIAYEVSGTFPDLLRFLAEIEQADFWADVSYFRLQAADAPSSATMANTTKSAVLTVSVFSADSEPRDVTAAEG